METAVGSYTGSTNQITHMLGCSLRRLITIHFIFTFKMAKKLKCLIVITHRYQFTVIRDVETFPAILEENLAKPSLSVIFTGDIDPETGKSWYVLLHLY